MMQFVKAFWSENVFGPEGSFGGDQEAGPRGSFYPDEDTDLKDGMPSGDKPIELDHEGNVVEDEDKEDGGEEDY